MRNLGALDKGLALACAGGRSSADEKAGEAEASLEPLAEDVEEPVGVPQTLFNQAVTPHATWDCRNFDLAAIRSMRKAVPGATVNDVLLTIVAGGLRHYLQHRDALPETPMKAGCPVNIRTEAEVAAGGNRISAIVVNMHTDIADPMERLRSITRSSAAAKARARLRGSRRILDVVDVVPAQAQALLGSLVGKVAGTLNRAVVFNTSVSNLPGPQSELHMLGARLQSIGAAMPVMNGYGLFVGLTTCAGRLSISASSCASIVPDPEVLGDCMERSFGELLRSALPGPRRARARATQRKRKSN